MSGQSVLCSICRRLIELYSGRWVDLRMRNIGAKPYDHIHKPRGEE